MYTWYIILVCWGILCGGANEYKILSLCSKCVPKDTITCLNFEFMFMCVLVKLGGSQNGRMTEDG
jgi:hypothetical protein